MRTIRLQEPESDRTWLWLAAGAALGLAAGVLVAERMSGRRVTVRSLLGKGGKLALRVARNWAPLLESARAVRDVWAERLDADDEPDLYGAEEPDELDEDELDDEALEAGLEGDEEELDEEAAEEEEEPEEADELDARVLEAFSHDPVLAERAVEIEEVADGEIVLHGRVRTAREVKHAVTIARGVPGVRRVRQRLAVGGGRARRR